MRRHSNFIEAITPYTLLRAYAEVFTDHHSYTDDHIRNLEF